MHTQTTPLRHGWLTALTGVLALLLSACGGDKGGSEQQSSGASSVNADGPLIGMSLDTLREERWQRDRDMVKNKIESLGGRLKYLSANSNDAQQLQDVKNLIAAGCKVIIIIPHDGKAMGAAVNEAAKHNIPCIAYDRVIENTDKLSLYLTFDNIKVGEAQATYLVEELKRRGKDKAKIVRIYGQHNDNNAKMFKQGQDNILQAHIDSGFIEVVHEDWCENWEPANAVAITKAAMAKKDGANFDGVLASNDGTAAGAIQALKSDQADGKIVVTGQDADLGALQRIVAGTQSMTVYKPLPVLAEMTGEVAMKLAKGETVDTGDKLNNGMMDVPSVFSKIYTVTKDNIMDTIIKDGFHPYDAVYQGVPDDQRPPKP